MQKRIIKIENPKLKAVMSIISAIAVALIVESVGFGQYIATYLTAPEPAREIWKMTGIIVGIIVASWTGLLAIKENKENGDEK